MKFVWKLGLRATGLTWILSVLLAAPAVRAESWVRPDGETVPAELQEAGITERLGASVDLKGLRFTDEQGQEVQLAKYFKKGKPVLLTLVYYNCPNLCHYLLNGFLEDLKAFEWTVGDQFEVVTVSINPRETADLAGRKKKSYIDEYGRGGEGTKDPAAGWHFLVGKESQIKRLASQVGFGYRYDEKQKEYAHSAAVMVLTPEGKVSRYLYGIRFPAKDLRLALLEASNGKVGTIMDRVLLFCFHYDPSKRGYALHAFRVVQAGGAGTVLVVGSYFFVFWRRQRRLHRKKNGT